ncbi:MAG: ACP S-malonyltransferase, partial [Actinobacteria bacterium]|nr:ACP S-malonyltransferase [Actinomycetota bacterium]
MQILTQAVIFPGQGAQARGMGLPWRDHGSWAVVERAEKVLEQPLAHLLTGEPLPDGEPVDLSRTANSQLSVLLASLMSWEALRPLVPTPVAFAGHSLGQITALIAAEALSFDDGIRLAWERANLTQRDADSRPGRMVALLGASPEQAEQACAGVDGCWVANDNTVGQIVLAGTPDGVEAGAEAARAAGVRKVMALDVGGAFHTPLFEPAATDLRAVLAGGSIRRPRTQASRNQASGSQPPYTQPAYMQPPRRQSGRHGRGRYARL